MAKYEITAPDGNVYEVTAPDSATQEEVLSYAKSKFGSQQKPAMEHQSYSRVPPVQSMGSPLDFLSGLGGGIADLGRGTKQRFTEGGRLFGKYGDEDVQKLYDEEAARRERREFDPGVTAAEKAGRGIGMIGGTLPLAFVPGGQTAVGSTIASLLAGGAAGAMLPATSGNEAALNISSGAAGQALGNLAGRLALPTNARNLTQAQKNVLDAASKERIPLRTSEATGSRVIRNWEQMRSNRPITGPMEERFNERQSRAINEAFTRRLGRPIPEVNQQELKRFADEIGGEIGSTMKGKTVPLDKDFFNALVAVDADISVGGKLTSTPELTKTIDNALDLIVNKPKVSGEVAQRIRSRLLDRARDARAQENNELAGGLEDIVDGLKKAMEGTLSASELEAWRTANRRYANYKIVEEAFARDPKSLALGDVPINKMARVMEQNRPRSYTHGKGDFAELATLGQIIRPPGQSALLGAQGTVGIKNAGDVISGMAYPVIESQLMQRYLTGGFPIQRSIRDVRGAAAMQDALMRAAGLTLLTEDESKR